MGLNWQRATSCRHVEKKVLTPHIPVETLCQTKMMKKHPCYAVCNYNCKLHIWESNCWKGVACISTYKPALICFNLTHSITCALLKCQLLLKGRFLCRLYLYSLSRLPCTVQTHTLTGLEFKCLCNFGPTINFIPKLTGGCWLQFYMQT